MTKPWPGRHAFPKKGATVTTPWHLIKSRLAHRDPGFWNDPIIYVYIYKWVEFHLHTPFWSLLKWFSFSSEVPFCQSPPKQKPMLRWSTLKPGLLLGLQDMTANYSEIFHTSSKRAAEINTHSAWITGKYTIPIPLGSMYGILYLLTFG